MNLQFGNYRVSGPYHLPNLMAAAGLMVAEVADLPPNWKDLDWYLAVQSPCLIGDDLRIAVDRQAAKTYGIFDGYCGDWYPCDADASLEELLRSAAEYEPPKVYR